MKVAQLCLSLCDPMDYSLPGASVHGILQVRILEWVAVPFSRRSSKPRDWTQVSHIASGFLTTWATREAQGYWSGKSISSPGDLPNPGIKPQSPALHGDFFFTSWAILVISWHYIGFHRCFWNPLYLFYHWRNDYWMLINTWVMLSLFLNLPLIKNWK